MWYYCEIGRTHCSEAERLEHRLWTERNHPLRASKMTIMYEGYEKIQYLVLSVPCLTKNSSGFLERKLGQGEEDSVKESITSISMVLWEASGGTAHFVTDLVLRVNPD